jgi:hypothetical protein
MDAGGYEKYAFAPELVFADFDRAPYGSRYPGELIVIAGRAA